MKDYGYDVYVKIASDDRILKWSRYVNRSNANDAIANWRKHWSDDKIWLVDRAADALVDSWNTGSDPELELADLIMDYQANTEQKDTV